MYQNTGGRWLFLPELSPKEHGKNAKWAPKIKYLKLDKHWIVIWLIRLSDSHTFYVLMVELEYSAHNFGGKLLEIFKNVISLNSSIHLFLPPTWVAIIGICTWKWKTNFFFIFFMNSLFHQFTLTRCIG